MKGFTRHLYFWVLVGIVLGVIVGWLWPDQGAAADAFRASSLKPLGDGFINVVKMLIIAPVIFLTLSYSASAP